MWQDPVPREISVMFARALYGPGGPTTCELPDGRHALLERNPSPEVVLRARIEGEDALEAFPLTAFAPVGERPPAYPADLPFLPERRVTVAVGRGQRVLGWMGVPDADTVIEEVVRQSAADGWQGGSVEHGLLGARTVLRKGGRERVVLSMWIPPILKLVERATGEAD